MEEFRKDILEKLKKREEEKKKIEQRTAADFVEFEEKGGKLKRIEPDTDIKKIILQEEFDREWRELNERHQKVLAEMEEQEERLRKAVELEKMADEAKELIEKIKEREKELKEIEQKLEELRKR